MLPQSPRKCPAFAAIQENWYWRRVAKSFVSNQIIQNPKNVTLKLGIRKNELTGSESAEEIKGLTCSSQPFLTIRSEYFFGFNYENSLFLSLSRGKKE